MKILALLFCVLISVTLAAEFANKIDKQVYYQLMQEDAKGKADINVLLTETADLTGFENIKNHDERGQNVLDAVSPKKLKISSCKPQQRLKLQSLLS
jgi:hypothetical protein